MRTFFILVALLLAPLAHATGQETPPGRIAFASDRTGIYQVYVANADGSELQQITDGPNPAFLPLWSPDGERLLYAESVSDEDLSDRPVTRLMLTDLDGGEPVEIARDPEGGFMADPSRYLRWSPDSQRIVYGVLTDDERGRHQRYYVDALDGNEPVEVASPEVGEDIAFVQFLDNDTLLLTVPFSLYRANLDGSEPELLIDSIGAPAALSPDGRQIAAIDGGDLTLYDADGQNPVVVMEAMPGPVDGVNVAFANSLMWSPDGEWLSGAVFLLARQSLESTPEPTPETPLPRQALFTVRADGTDYHVFTAADLILTWSPDSTHIAYTVWQDGVAQVAVARPDGSDLTIITGEGSNAQPAWQPQS